MQPSQPPERPDETTPGVEVPGAGDILIYDLKVYEATDGSIAISQEIKLNHGGTDVAETAARMMAMVVHNLNETIEQFVKAAGPTWLQDLQHCIKICQSNEGQLYEKLIIAHPPEKDGGEPNG